MTYTQVPGCRLAIGFVGQARHGKDTAAKAVLRAMPGAERFAFSDAVSVIGRVCHGMVKRDAGLLQTIGTGYRAQRETVWLDALYGLIRDREPDIAVVTGLRYRDEVELVRALARDSVIIRVVRRQADGSLFVAADRDPSHPVEQGIAALPADLTIEARSGEIDRLGRHVVALLADRQAARLVG